MKHGDFSTLAQWYGNRPGYSPAVVRMLAAYTGASRSGTPVADIGAGTGKFTENLAEAELGPIVAVEPNDEMRAHGVSYTSGRGIEWRKGSAEQTGLDSGAFGWLTMASSFHWTAPEKSLPEFHRVLRSGGFFTALWNPRALEKSALHTRIEQRIYNIAPEIQRVSSGSAEHMKGVGDTLIATGHFRDVVFVEAEHEVFMSRERYLDTWRSVNDIQVQAGPERFARILEAIREEIATLPEIVVPYRTRSWTARRID